MASLGLDYTGADLPPSNSTVAFTVAPEANFDLKYEAVVSGLFWAFLLVHGATGLHKLASLGLAEARNLQRWPLYFMMLGYLVVTAICESCGLLYSIAALNGTASDAVYLAYIFFWHASTAAFLVLLLALSSGYCITRGDLEGQRAKVILIPTVVFVAGVASDFTFVYVQSSQPLSTAADRYNIVEMTGWEEAVWFMGSLANIMCFVMAWVYVFDSTALEINALDAAQQALQRKPEEAPAPSPSGPGRHGSDDDSEDDTRPGRSRSQGNDPALATGTATNGISGGRGAVGKRGAAGRAARALGTTSQRQGLLYGLDRSSQGPGRDRHRARAESGSLARTGSGGPTGFPSAGGDVEQGQPSGSQETFADHLEFTVRKRLLTRFYYCVCGYLLASMSVVLLPAFFNGVVQNTLVVLQFVVKYLFAALLAWTFRPARDSPYLQVGLSDNDADDRGVSALDTELTVTDHRSSPPLTASSRPGLSAGQGPVGPNPAAPGRFVGASGDTALASASGASAPAWQGSHLPVSVPAGNGEGPVQGARKAGGYQALSKADGDMAGHGVEVQHHNKPRFTLGDDD